MSTLLFVKYLGWQLVSAVLLTVAGFGIGGRDGALAAVAGSIIAIVPNVYFTVQAFRYRASEEPVRTLSAIYRGEAGKFVLVMVLCALAFRSYEFRYPLILFMALFAILVTQTLASVCVLPSLQKAGTSATRENEIN